MPAKPRCVPTEVLWAQLRALAMKIAQQARTPKEHETAMKCAGYSQTYAANQQTRGAA